MKMVAKTSIFVAGLVLSLAAHPVAAASLKKSFLHRDRQPFGQPLTDSLTTLNHGDQQPADALQDPPAAPAHVSAPGEACHPQCKWSCGKPPSRCDEVCEPVCAPPQCETACLPMNFATCRQRCDPPKCAVICPSAHCPHGDCPKCKTVCAPPKCYTDCGEKCESKCSAPQCTWNCKPSGAECPQPACQIDCDTPQACGFDKEVNAKPDPFPEGFQHMSTGLAAMDPFTGLAPGTAAAPPFTPMFGNVVPVGGAPPGMSPLSTGKACTFLMTGACAAPITTQEACSAAAEKVGMGRRTARDDMHPQGVDFDPPFCYMENDVLYFNAGANTGQCSNSNQCLCAECAASYTAPPVVTPSFALQTSGDCLKPLTTLAACTAAGRAAGLGSAAYDDMHPDGVSYDPPYCYFENNRVMFNAGKNTGQCSDTDKCVCEGGVTPPLGSPPGTGGPAGPLSFAFLTRGNCLNPIRTLDDCTDKAHQFGLTDALAEDDTHLDGVSFDPPFCYMENNKLKFNAGRNSGVCSPSDKCVCVDGLAASSLPPPGAPHAPLTPPVPAAVMPPPTMLVSGVCTNPITSMAACSAAGAKLSLANSTAVDDKHPKGVSYDPPYCYYENSILKFNAGNNTGSCTKYDECLCADTLAAGAPVVGVPAQPQR